MHIRGICLLLISFFLLTGGNAQQLRMTTYTVTDGLLSNTIRKIFQDSRGNIWISTVDGLSKYDGHRFTNYSKSNGLPYTFVNDMLETDGNLVFACNDGTLAWMQHDRIVKITNPGTVINQFCRLKSGKVLVATDKHGIQEFRNGQLYKPPQPYPQCNYYSISEINDSLILAGTDSSAEIMTKELKLKKCFGRQHIYYGANHVLRDSRGRMWASHLPDPVQLSSTDIVYSPSANIPELQGSDIQQVFEDRAGNIWFAGIYGLVQLSPEGKVRTLKKKNGLLSDVVVCIFQDKEDNLWIGTSLGLCKMPTATIVTTFDEADGLAYPTISAMFRDNDNKFITVTIKGWQYFDKKEERFSPLISENALPYAIHRLLVYHPALQTDAGFLVLKDSKAGKDIQDFLSRQALPTHIFRMAGFQQCYFMSVGWAFYVYDGNKVFEDTSLHFSRHANYTITGLVVDKKGALWAGTWDEGLFKLEFNIENGQFRFTKKTSVLPKVGIRTVMIDKQGNIWAGTRYNGVFRLKQSADGNYQTESWNSENGLASNWVHTLYQDDRNNIWLVYQDGLDKLVNHDGVFRVFNFSRINNFYANISHILPGDNGSLWLGTYNGVIHLQGGEMEKISPWPVTITGIAVGDTSYSPQTMPPSFAYYKNSLRVDFSALTYLNEKQVLYSYRMIGSADTAWSRPENLHSVSFASLKPGRYQFEVRTLGWNGQWGDITSVPWTIIPPVWQRDWFIVVCFLLVAAIVIILVRVWIRYLKNELAMKQQLVETEMMALRAQMNPHFLFNSLNAIDNLIQTHQPDKATTYLGRFARLLRLVLDSSKNKLVPFDRDFTAMQLYLDMEKFRSADKFQFDISAEPELLNGGYSIPPLLAQPFIENAIHHGLMNKAGGDRRLNVKASLAGDFIMINITDNGVGRARSSELNKLNRPDHTSYGWQITAQRLGLHNGGNGEEYIVISDLYDQEQPSGTSVTLIIKVNGSTE